MPEVRVSIPSAFPSDGGRPALAGMCHGVLAEASGWTELMSVGAPVLRALADLHGAALDGEVHSPEHLLGAADLAVGALDGRRKGRSWKPGMDPASLMRMRTGAARTGDGTQRADVA